jgi:hypothetical protein
MGQLLSERCNSMKGEGETDPFSQVVEDLDLNERLVVEALLVADDLDGDGLARLVVAALDDLAERAFAEDAHDLVPVAEVVAVDDEIVAPVVVVAVVERAVVELGHLLLATDTDAVDLGVLGDLAPLVVGQVGEVRLDHG